jgi:hypothetical protein
MTSSEKPQQPASNQQPQKPFSRTEPWRERSPEELRALGVPIRNDLVISPVPRSGRNTPSER